MQFDNVRTDAAIISDKVTAAMETGNPARAREVLAEYSEWFPTIVENLRREVLQQYGVAL